MQALFILVPERTAVWQAHWMQRRAISVLWVWCNQNPGSHPLCWQQDLNQVENLKHAYYFLFYWHFPILNFKNYFTVFVYLLYSCACVIMCTHATTNIWKINTSQESVFSFHHVGHRYKIQAITVSGKHFYLLSLPIQPPQKIHFLITNFKFTEKLNKVRVTSSPLAFSIRNIFHYHGIFCTVSEPILVQC